MSERPEKPQPAPEPKSDSAFNCPLWLAYTRRVLREVAEGK